MRPNTKRLSSVPTLLAAMVLISPAGLEPATHRLATTVVTGRVLDPTGHAVASATLIIASKHVRAFSGSDGRYVLSAARGGESEHVQLQVAKAGFESRRLSVFLHGDTVRADITLTPSPIRTLELEPAYAASASTNTSQDRAEKVAAGSVTGATPPSPRPANRAMLGAAGSLIRATPPGYYPPRMIIGRRPPRERGNTEAYDHIDENPFRSPRVAPPRSRWTLTAPRTATSGVSWNAASCHRRTPSGSRSS